jgi:outer membrane protein assembly factor BamD (BamD/ComL family)
VNDVIVWQKLISESEGDSAVLVKFAEGDLFSFQLKPEQAIGAFQEVRTTSPKGRVGQEALVRIGLELRASGRPQAAVDSLRQFLTLFPSSLQVDDVQFLIGDILERDVRDIPAAIKQYEQLLIEHPGGMYMEEARRRIRQLESYRQT